jgi:hypothetical protein
LFTWNVERRELAFCLIDKNHRLIDLGGSLGTYGLGDLREGQDVENRFSFLEGNPVGDKDTVILPRVIVTSGVYADVHIISEEAGLWIVLLDATAEAEQLQLMQQRGNETNLLRERIVQLHAQLEAAQRTIAQLRDELNTR